MQLSSKLLFRTAVLLMGVLLAIVVMLGVINANQAGATNTSDLAIVKQYVEAYITNQFGTGGTEGEDGFIITAASLNSRINSVNDSAILGEGDDAAQAPVLVDNFSSSGTFIPGTTNRCFWNTGATGTGVAENCFNNNVLNLVKAKADAHAAAGFSTDVVVYCVSGHTEAPTTGAFGFIAQTGRLRSDGSIPKVFALKWGRNGWTNAASPAFNNTNAVAASDAAGSNTPPSSVAAASACNSSSGNAELVRCQAQWAIYNGTVNGMTGGNVGNGVAQLNIGVTIANDQTVDIRTGTPNTVSATGSNIRVPINTIFGSGMTSLHPTTTSVVVSRTPMVGGIVAEGMKMLGYTMRTGGFINGGIRGWKNTEGEAPASDGQTRVPLSSAAIDATAPTISASGVSNITTSSADVYRTTNEPATSKIALVGSDGHVVNANNTVLNASKTVPLSALHAGVTYTGTLTAYDGQANGTSVAVSFTTVSANTPPVVTVPANITAEASSASGAVVTFTATATDAEDGPLTPVCTPASGSTFPLGPTTVSCTATDSGGLSDTKSFTVTVVDTTAPTLSYAGPTGTVGTSNPTVTGAASDAVGVTSVTLSIDGGAPSACTIDGAGNVSCATSGLADGPHSAVITALDAAGNSTSVSGSFTVSTCTAGKPSLTMGGPVASWGTYANYVAKKLSVTWTVTNGGSTNAGNVAITSSTATYAPISTITAMPASIGNIAAGGTGSVVIQYQLPANFAGSGFRVINTASAGDCAGNSYTYP